jgi:hypothetical protein
MTLSEWFAQNPDAVETFHRRIKVSRMAVSRYRRRERIPDRDVMPRIYAETDGDVTPNDFYELPPLRNGKRKAEA